MGKKDESFMKEAMKQRDLSFDRGDIPVGAVLVIDDKIIDSGGNHCNTNFDYTSHAEANLIRKNASMIKKSHKENKNVVIYTTLEPCIMCFGMAVQNRIGKIIYSSPDPAGGATGLKPHKRWLKEHWTKIIQGPFMKENLEFFIDFMNLDKNKEGWKEIKSYFDGIKI